MHLGRNISCHIDNDPLQSKKQKVLSMIMDSNLKFHTHTPAVDKANQVLGLVASTSVSLCELVKY